MNTIHASGPWMAEKHPAGHYGIFQQEHAHQVAEVFDRNTSPEMVEANAHLIAAAPEMLDALLSVLRSIADPDGEHSVIEKIDAAVFKALGQNDQVELPPNGGSESKNGVVGG